MEKVEKAKFHVGDLVILKSASYEIVEQTEEEDDETIINDYLINADLSIPPCMVVIEVVLDTSKNKEIFDEKTGKPIESTDVVRYKCQWFSVMENSFKEYFFHQSYLLHATFQEDVSKIIALPNNQFEGEAKENEKVYLKTVLFEQKRNGLKSFPKVSYLPPEMLVLSVQEETNLPPLYDKKGTRDNKDAPLKPLVIREISKEKVKCMYYNPFTNKFTEHFFSREALIGVKS
jgi:uncharacterized protein YodC (DUF2158 family)